MTDRKEKVALGAHLKNRKRITRDGQGQRQMVGRKRLCPGPCEAPGEKTLGRRQEIDAWEDVASTESSREQLKWTPKTQQSKRLRWGSWAELRS